MSLSIAKALAQGFDAAVQVGAPTVEGRTVTWPVRVAADADCLYPIRGPEEKLLDLPPELSPEGKRRFHMELSCSPQADGSRRVTLLAPHSVFSYRGHPDNWGDVLAEGQMDVVARTSLLAAGLDPGVSVSVTVPPGVEMSDAHLLEVSQRLESGMDSLRERELELEAGDAAVAEADAAHEKYQIDLRNGVVMDDEFEAEPGPVRAPPPAPAAPEPGF